MKELFGILSFVLIIGVTIPYANDILKGRAKPARSTRILFFLLLLTTLIVQAREFTSWTLALTVAEFMISAVLLVLSFKYGLGGLKKIDKWSYVLFAIAVTLYIVTGDALLGLALLCVTDLVAFIPTIVKNWLDPTSDTPLFYFIGTIAPAFAILAASSYSDINQILFPFYLMVVNALALGPLLRHKSAEKGVI